MWSEIVLRIICTIILACLFVYVLFVQHSHWNWIDWTLLFVIPLLATMSVIGEIEYTDDKYTQQFKIYDYDRIFRKGYWLVRVINVIITVCLFWKIHENSDLLPISQRIQECALVIIGLFTILNFYYWLIGILSIIGCLYVWNNSGISGLWLYIASIGTLVLGIAIMFIVAININNWRWEQSRARVAARKAKEAARKAKELEEENNFMRRELERRYREENKWWKFWN